MTGECWRRSSSCSFTSREGGESNQCTRGFFPAGSSSWTVFRKPCLFQRLFPSPFSVFFSPPWDRLPRQSAVCFFTTEKRSALSPAKSEPTSSIATIRFTFCCSDFFHGASDSDVSSPVKTKLTLSQLPPVFSHLNAAMTAIGSGVSLCPQPKTGTG